MITVRKKHLNTALKILNQAIYWLAMLGLVLALCGIGKRQHAQFMLPTLKNINELEQELKHR